jgi:hypothetical protein
MTLAKLRSTFALHKSAEISDAPFARLQARAQHACILVHKYVTTSSSAQADDNWFFARSEVAV